MDPEMLLAVLNNLLSSALYDVITDPLFAGRRGGSKADVPRRGSAAYKAAVGEATHNFASQIRKLTDEEKRLVERFVQSEELKQITLQLFRTKLCGPQYSSAELRQVAASRWHEIAGDRRTSFSPFDFFDELVAAAGEVLTDAIRRGELEAHESMSAARHQLLIDRLAAIGKQLELMSHGQAEDVEATANFAEKIKSAVAGAHELVSPPSIRGAPSVPLDDIYVPPHFRLGGENQLSYDELRERTFRMVLLGTPGAGKSTFAKKLALDLATRGCSLSGDLRPVAVFLEVRGYAKHCERHPCGLREYVEVLLRTNYQLEPPDGVVESLLLSGKLAVFFDGLDELPRVGDRVNIKSRVEAFARQYAQAPIIVTSRAVGYEFAALDPRRFETVHIESFTEEQVELYASRWFDVDMASSGVRPVGTAADFVAESSTVKELRSNPLLLGLMCTLYRGRGYIPKNRPELYGACADLLFDSWDGHRGIEQLRPFEDLLRPTMRHLALWIYETPALQSGVSAPDAEERTAKFLCEQRFDDPLRAQRAAHEFIEFCRGRAWVFSDAGSDSDHNDVFKFTHRTFLEFFAAEQILSDCQTDEQLESVLLPRIQQGEWEIVCRLCVHMRGRRHLNSADAIIERMLDASVGESPGRRARVVAFAIQLLGEVGMKPATARRVYDEAFRVIEHGYSADSASVDGDRGVREVIIMILRCDADSRERAIEAWFAACRRLLGDGELVREALSSRCLGVELAGLIPVNFDSFEDELDLDAFEAWRRALLDLNRVEGDRYRLKAAYRSSDCIAYGAGWVGLHELIAAHGFGVVVNRHESVLLGVVGLSPIHSVVIGSSAIDSSAIESLFLTSQLPLIGAQIVVNAVDFRQLASVFEMNLDGELGRLMLALLVLESLTVPRSPIYRSLLHRGELELRSMTLIGQLFAARAGLLDPKLAAAELRRRCPDSGPARDLLERWAGGGVSFVEGALRWRSPAAKRVAESR